jgi:TonB family protein
METQEKVVPANAFASLPASRAHWSSFGISFLAQALLLVFLAETSISFMAPVLTPIDIDTHYSVRLVAPTLSPPLPADQPVAKVRELPVQRAVVVPKTQLRLPQAPPPAAMPKPPVEVAKVTVPTVPAGPDLASGPNVLRAAVTTNFGGSSAPVTEKKPARQVQTGGFGDPNGVPANPNATGKGPLIAKVGSFDLPQGPGSGNGTGGAKGARGTVASVGFGNGIAVQGEGSVGAGGQGRIRSTNFGPGEPAPGDSPKGQVTTAASRDIPVSLLTKPTPAYTLEARQRKIEGDVELEVEFDATGQLHVLHVLQSLGYGLDESAVSAAEKIRFAPARRNGQAIDTEGRLRIVFRLS